MKTRIQLREPIFVALETLRAHKLRSFLMLLGIVLSVSTLIMVVALISGVNLYVADRVANLGSNVFLVLRFPIIPDVNEFVKATRRNKPMTWDDYLYLRDNTKLAVRVGAQAFGVGRTKANGQSVEDTTIYGVTANIGDMKTEEPAQGRYITDADNEHRSMVALIGADVVEKLFPGRDPIGKELDIDGRPYEIVGVGKPIGTVLGQTQDNFVYIPIETYLKFYATSRTSLAINVQTRGGDWMSRSQEEMQMLMRARRGYPPPIPYGDCRDVHHWRSDWRRRGLCVRASHCREHAGADARSDFRGACCVDGFNGGGRFLRPVSGKQSRKFESHRSPAAGSLNGCGLYAPSP